MVLVIIIIIANNSASASPQHPILKYRNNAQKGGFVNVTPFHSHADLCIMNYSVPTGRRPFMITRVWFVVVRWGRFMMLRWDCWMQLMYFFLTIHLCVHKISYKMCPSVLCTIGRSIIEHYIWWENVKDEELRTQKTKMWCTLWCDLTCHMCVSYTLIFVHRFTLYHGFLTIVLL